MRIGRARPADVEGLAGVLVDCVEGGASVGFLAPLDHERAAAYWHEVLDGPATTLVAEVDGEIVGTVQLVPARPENQPHRADVSKLLVHRRARGAGVGDALMAAAEAEAAAVGRPVLVLDTATPAAARLYHRRRWTEVGTVPDYAMDPDGTRCATTFFTKQLGTR